MVLNEEQWIKELREKASRKKWPAEVAQVFEKELRKLERLHPQSPDYSVQTQYVQNIVNLPWNEYSKDNFNLSHAQKVLDRDHYGLEKVKERIIEHLAVLKLKGDMKSPIICLYGPPGVGKTSLGRSIAEALRRKYVRVSLGGLHDESEIRGHRKTYIGAMPGRILQSIKKAGTSNPVFILDEIDKVGNDFRGDPQSALLEVLDPEQNTTFHDNFLDVDYDLWNERRASIQTFSRMSQSCIFTVDVFKERYDFASDNFATIFGYNPTWIKTIQKQGNLLEERIHPDDRAQLIEHQIEHGQFIYSLPREQRNDYQQIFQFRMLNVRQKYVNVISRHQVIQKDKKGKAWIIMGVMDILPDQTPIERIKRTVVNRKTGEMLPTCTVSPDKQLSNREKEILRLIRQGFLSKEIAYQLGVSIYTVNNHRKNILSKLNANNIMEAIHIVENLGIYL